MAVAKPGRFALCASLALASCGGGGSPPGGGGGGGGATPPPVVTRSYTFPTGDATASTGATAWDITGVTTTLSGQFGNANGNSYDTLRVDVTFAQNAANALPAPGQALTLGTQLGIRIALDTDANPATGSVGGCSPLNPQMPFEYITDQGHDPSRLMDGNYSILANGAPIASGGQNPPAEAMVAISGNVMSETFFLAAIGIHAGPNVPRLGLSVAAANASDMNANGVGPTDCVPIPPAVEFFTS